MTARFLLDPGIIQQLANVDTSFGECATDGRLALYVDYRRGIPQSLQLVRMPTGVSFKIHVMQTDSA